jgi:hypothetical protein
MAAWINSAGATQPDGNSEVAVLDGGRTIITRGLDEADVLLVFGSDRPVAERALALLAGG